MSKFAGFIIGAVLIAVGVVTGNPALIVQGGAMIVSNAILLLTQPKTPARQASEMSIALGEQPRVLLVGETFTPGSLVDGFNYGGKYDTDWEVLVIRLADHKCEGLTGFYVNDEYVPYNGNGNYPQFDTHHFSLWFRADTTNEPLPDVILENGPGWESSDIGASGCDVTVAYLADKPDAKHPAWPGGRPRFGFVVKGKLCYDPRLDDTVTGGSGTHRWDDPDTWEWTENAAVCRYNWVRGIYANDDVSDQTGLLVGRGLTAEEAPPENIFAAANLCDEVLCPNYPTSERTTTQNLGAVFVTSPKSPWMAYGDNSDWEWWYLPTRSVTRKSGEISEFGGDAAMAPDGTVYEAGADSHLLDVIFRLYVTPPGGSTTKYDFDSLWRGKCRPFDDATGERVVYTGSPVAGYTDFTTFTALPESARNFCQDDDGVIWAVTQPDGASSAFSIVGINGSSDSNSFTATARSDVSTCWICYVASEGHFIVEMDDHWYAVDKATWTITDSGSSGSIDFSALPWNDPSATSMWNLTGTGAKEISLADLTTIRTVTGWDTTAPDDWVYSPFNHAVIMRPDLGGPLTWLLIDRHAGYRVAGPIYSNQDFIDVEGMFAAATGGTVVTREGSVELNPGHAESIVATFTDADLLTGSGVSWNNGALSEASDEWVNTVVARYVEPDQKWNDHAAPVMRDTDDIIADGKPREASISLRLVRYSEQAQRIAELQRRLGRLWGRATVTLGPRFCEIEEGDWIAWESDRYFGGDTKTFRVEAYQIDEKWHNTLTLREISATVYDCPVYIPDLSEPTYNPPPIDIGAPDEGDWTLTASTLDSTGSSIPILLVQGAVPEDEFVETIIIEYWLDDGIGDPVADPDSVSWISFGRYPPDTTRVQITGLTGGATYYVAITYVVSGILGDRLVLGPATVSDYSTNLRRTADTTLITADTTAYTADAR